MSSPKNSNNFRNATKPTVVPIQGRQSGEIPSWVEGNLFRTGPGLQEIGPDKYKHFFDGLAVLHRFEIKNGTAHYQSRYLESDSFLKNMKAQRIVVSEFGTHRSPDPCKSLLGRFMSYFQPIETTDNCNVNVAFYGDQLYAMTETQFVRRLNPKNLETGAKVDLANYMAVNHATAHPHVLPDGSMLNMGNNYKHKKGPHYCIIQVPPTYESDETSFKDAKVIAEIPCRWKMYPCYYHSFSMTETGKIVFVEQPYCLSVPKIVTSNLRGDSYRECISWYPNEKTRIHVVSFKTGEIHPIVYEASELFMFHQVNAYEEDGHIVLDLAAYNSAEFVEKAVKGTMLDDVNREKYIEGASLRRYILPLEIPKEAVGTNLVKLPNARATAVLRPQTTDKEAPVVDLTADHLTDWTEFPRINYKYNGQKYRYVYGVAASDARKKASVVPEADILFKYDLQERKMLTWENGGVLAGEPVFIQNPNASSEDDGVLLSPLLHVNDDNKITLLVLDASNMKELASVEFTTGGPVPTTFHGQWAQDGARVHIL